MWKRQPKKPMGVLEKRAPSNPKYKQVMGKLNTGLTVDKLKNVTSREFVKRRDEIHYRVNKRQMYELYEEYELADEEHFGGGVDMSALTEGSPGRHTPRIVTHSEVATPAYEKPYLLLDVRPAEQFQIGHLMQARSYPYTMIRRDFMHPEIFKFKNKENMLVIVYCDDERISRDVGKTLVDRGVDNVFLLTGGMNEFAVDYPSYVEGEVPNIQLPPQRPKPFAFLAPIREDGDGRDLGDHVFASATPRSPLTARSRSSAGGGSGAVSRMSSRGGRGAARRDGDDSRSESGMSTHSNFSVAESIYSRAVSRQGKGVYR